MTVTIPTFAEIRQALVTTVASNVDMELFEYPKVADVTQCPAIVTKPLSAKYMVNMGQDATYEIQFVVLCSRRDTVTGQDDLDALVSHYGPNSIPRAINDHGDLGIDGVTAICYAMDAYGGEYAVAKIPHVGAILKVRVEADP